MLMMSLLPKTEPSRLPPVAITLLLAAAALWWLAPITTSDMDAYLVPWFAHIVATRPVAAFAQPFSNYSPAYLYLLAGITPFDGLAPVPVLIKLLSLAGTGALAFAVRHLLARLDVPHPGRAAALVFLLPTSLLNAELLGQCDAMWSAACIMALAAAIDRKHRAMLVWCGIAFGFKAQAALVAPFFLALLINRRVPVREWLIMPLAMAATMLPAWLAGWPAFDLATIYFHQADYSPRMALNAPNIWAIVQALPALGALPLAGLAFAATIGATAAYVAWFSVKPLEGRALLAPALLSPLITAGLLPHMHERYFFLADILALVFALAMRDSASWRIAIRVQIGSTAALMGYLAGLDALAVFGAIAMILATLDLARPLVKPAANDNPLLVRAT